MFSQLLLVRLKAAENALRDGRLDEAYRLATAPDIREHRRGGAVLAALTERFLERARNHFRADRFTEASMDLDKAEAGGVLKEQIAELRQHVKTVMAEQQRIERSRRDRLAAARRRMEDGSLAAGRELLDQAGEQDRDAGQLRREIDRRLEEANRIADQAEDLINRGQMSAAAARLRKARAIDAHGVRVAAVESRLCQQVFANVREAVVEGRLSRAADELACLGALGSELPARRELDGLLSAAQQACASLRSDAPGEARRHAMTVKRLVPEAAWIETVIEQLRQLEDLRTALFAGPLGSGMTGLARKASALTRRAAPVGAVEDTVALPRGGGSMGGLPESLLLLVDGGGSYLILRGGKATIGRVASHHPADVAIYSDVAERHANVQRVDDDYFLFAAKDVEVGGKKTQHCLLKDGDRIVLGKKAKLTFRLPSRKSPTAVLDLSDTTKMPNDVRRVVFFTGHATVGEGSHAHIRCRHAGPPLVLFERNGELWIRQRGDGHVDTEARPLALGTAVEIGGASLVIKRWGGPAAGPSGATPGLAV